LLRHAPVIAEEAARFIPRRNARKGRHPHPRWQPARACRSTKSIGHPIELDRVLGQEANFAGTSFLTLDQLNQLQYASSIVNVVADAGSTTGRDSVPCYDDEGVPAQCTDIIKNGKFRGYLSNRETAHLVGLNALPERCRTESWNRPPIIRMTNVSLLLARGTTPICCRHARRNPDGDESLLSIDDRRYQFQFFNRNRLEIKGGKKVRMRRIQLQRITTEF